MDKVWNGAGKPLGEDIRRLGREELIALALEVCEGAADCGAAFHGNIHPGNITRDAEGRSRLGPRADHAPGDWSTDELEYMAPELFWNGTADASADVYSIGLLLYAGVTGGLLPFFKRAPENMTNELRASALRRRMNGDEIHTPAAAGEKLGPVIEKCLKFEVSARYKDTRELAEALRPCVGEGDAKAMEMFGKPERELSEVERTMAGILAHLEPEEEEEAPPKRGKALKIGIIVALLLAIAAVAYYLLTWYFVDVKKLNMLSCTTEQMVVELDSEDSIDRFALTCTDSYGNAYPFTVSGNRFTFTGLRENTTYTVTVTAAARHKLTSASTYTLSVTTPEATEITSFTATRGDADGEVLLSFTQEGPAPARWKLSYDDGSGKSDTFEFDGNSYLVTGLEQYKSYTFTLENTDSVYLSGQTTVEYELLPIVEAKNLNISEINGNSVTVVWEAGENLPKEWTLTCEAEGLTPSTGTTSETSYTFTLPDLSRDYTFSVSAGGMDSPESFVLPSNPIIVENIAAKVNEDGTVTLTWDTPIGAPEGGWYISYNTVGSFHAAYMPDADNSAVTGNSVVLRSLIPNAEYEVSLALTANDTSRPVFGTTKTTFRTAEAGVLDEFGVSPTPPLSAASGYISLWLLPEKENWNYNDLRNHKTTFSSEEEIAVCIEINAVNSSTDEVTLLYVLRDEAGKVLNDVSKTLPWNDMWYSRRHAGAIPLPASSGEASVAGNYTLEIYVNGKLLASSGFTIA